MSSGMTGRDQGGYAGRYTTWTSVQAGKADCEPARPAPVCEEAASGANQGHEAPDHIEEAGRRRDESPSCERLDDSAITSAHSHFKLGALGPGRDHRKVVRRLCWRSDQRRVGASGLTL